MKRRLSPVLLAAGLLAAPAQAQGSPDDLRRAFALVRDEALVAVPEAELARAAALAMTDDPDAEPVDDETSLLALYARLTTQKAANAPALLKQAATALIAATGSRAVA